MTSAREPRLSVVIATFDGLPHLRLQLEALAGERQRTAFEVVVADNGSTDGTVAAVQQYADRLDLTMIDASAQRGRTFARNEGARHARGDALLFLDQDDEVAPGYIDAMREALAQHRLVAARMDGAALNPDWRASGRQLPQADGVPHGPLPWAYGCTLGIERATFERAGGFDPNLRAAAEDIDLCWRLGQSGELIAYVPDAVLRYRFPSTLRGSFRQGRRYGLGYVQVCRKHPEVATMRVTLALWGRGFAASVWRAFTSRRRGERLHSWFLLGRRIGQLDGALRYRTLRW